MNELIVTAPSEVENLISLVQARAWYPFAAMLLTFLITSWRAIQPKVWERIPRRWQWLPVAMFAGAGAFVDAFSTGKSWQVALAFATYALYSAALPAIGFHHVAKRSS
jgi:hypothetical protein